MRKKGLYSIMLCLVILSACQKQQSTDIMSSNSHQTNINWNNAGPDAKVHQLTFVEVKQAVENGAVFFDVRSSEEFNTSNFGITTNFPITDLEKNKLPDLPKDTPIYVHCLAGIRSAQATKILRDAGFNQVYDLGGIEHVQAIGGVLK